MSAARWAGRTLIGLLVLLGAINLWWVAHNWTPLRTVSTPAGSSAPDFALPLLDGGELHLSDARGRPLVLAFWATWCEPCRVELPQIDRLARSSPTARFVAVNIDGVDPSDAKARVSIRRFMHALGLTLPVALDAGQVAAQYHVEAIPHTVVIDASGKVHRVLSGLHDEAELAAAVESARQPAAN
jgi:thiol-disulfide isomerase/thioredoxin